ncbi:hypothetical protein B296_00057149 [Ensete ventricosum]|uniref:Uncharacterized protein n=1 Tax=Ensete ventricosum TaxID=4639 RepID=A0A426XSH8_ENSVE|nr:hypothetical protein B296_00057149 [Ensete ventricosum]
MAVGSHSGDTRVDLRKEARASYVWGRVVGRTQLGDRCIMSGAAPNTAIGRHRSQGSRMVVRLEMSVRSSRIPIVGMAQYVGVVLQDPHRLVWLEMLALSSEISINWYNSRCRRDLEALT